MCRFYAGQIFMLDVLKKYDWIWRIDDDSVYICDIPYDPFRILKENGKIYGYAVEWYILIFLLLHYENHFLSLFIIHTTIISATLYTIQYQMLNITTQPTFICKYRNIFIYSFI